jgi:uridine kinase
VESVTISTKPEDIAAYILELVDAGTATPIVLIDGRAGSGKSTLAAELKNQIFKQGESAPRVVHMDDLYEGWHGLQAGVDYLQRFILNPISRRVVAHWQQFDWVTETRETGAWREFTGGTPLIVEGCGSLSAAASEVADLRIWLEAPEEVRQARWVERDGHKFDDKWPIWAAQEIDFYAREKSVDLADLIIANG